MDHILRFSEAVKRDSAIDTWFRERPAELGSIAQKWFARMRRCGADVRELMHVKGAGKNMRHVKLKPGTDVDETALDDLIEAAYRDGRIRAAKGFVDDDVNWGY